MYINSQYLFQTADKVNEALDKFPTAKAVPIAKLDENGATKIEGFKAIEVTDNKGRSEIVAVPTKRYTIVQHRDAFRPIVEGLVQAGVKDFGFITRTRGAKAQLHIFTKGAEVSDGASQIHLGIKCENSYDGSTAVNYGFTTKRMDGMWTIELVGYRELCSNGMKLIIPILTDADVARVKKEGMELGWRAKFTGNEKVLHAQKESIRHTSSATLRIEQVQYVTEALALLMNPVQEYIQSMKDWTITDDKMLRSLIKAHVGGRYAAKVRKSYYGAYGGEGEQNLWGLYNAITYVASHDTIAESAREGLIDRAAKMPLKVMTGVQG